MSQTLPDTVRSAPAPPPPLRPPPRTPSVAPKRRAMPRIDQRGSAPTKPRPRPIAISLEARILGSLRAPAMAVRVPHGTLLSPWPILTRAPAVRCRLFSRSPAGEIAKAAFLAPGRSKFLTSIYRRLVGVGVGGVRARGGMADLADAAAAAMDEGLQEGQEFMDKFTRFLERDVRTPLCSLGGAGERDSLGGAEGGGWCGCAGEGERGVEGPAGADGGHEAAAVPQARQRARLRRRHVRRLHQQTVQGDPGVRAGAERSGARRAPTPLALALAAAAGPPRCSPAAPSAHRRRAAPRSGTWTRRTDGRTG